MTSEGYYQSKLSATRLRQAYDVATLRIRRYLRAEIGKIDRSRTRNGAIVCKDGFTASIISPKEFTTLCSPLGAAPRIEEVDGSSLFCEIRVD